MVFIEHMHFGALVGNIFLAYFVEHKILVRSASHQVDWVFLLKSGCSTMLIHPICSTS